MTLNGNGSEGHMSLVSQLLINIILVIVWAALSESAQPGTLLTGYLFGAGIIYVICRTTGAGFYLENVGVAFELVVVFIYELVLANVRMAYQIIHPALPISPGIIAYPLQLKTDGQITLLAAIITMTPGTLSVAVSDDRTYLFVHVLDLDDPDEVKERIRVLFEERILKVVGAA